MKIAFGLPQKVDRQILERDTTRGPIFLLLVVLLFLSAVVGAFYLYVVDREQFFNDRYFRLLHSQADNLVARLDNYHEIFQSAVTTRFHHRGDPPRLQPAVTLLTADGKHFDRADPSRTTRCSTQLLADASLFWRDFLCQVPEFTNVQFLPPKNDKQPQARIPLAGEGRNPQTNSEMSGATPSPDRNSPTVPLIRTFALMGGMPLSTGTMPPPDKNSRPRSSTEPIDTRNLVPCAEGNSSSGIQNGTLGPSQSLTSFVVRPVQRGAAMVFRLEGEFDSSLPVQNSKRDPTEQPAIHALPRSGIAQKNLCFVVNWLVTAEVDANDLFSQTSVEDAFDSLLLATSGGAVLFHHGRMGVRFSHLRQLYNSAQTSKDNKTNLDLDDGEFVKRLPPREEVRVGDATMLAYSHPLQLGEHKSSGEMGGRYLLVGLVAKDKFRQDTWQLSPSVLLMLVLLISLVVLSLPLLKLFTMGPQDRWTLGDFCLLISAGSAGTGLIALALTDASAFLETKRQIDSELSATAEIVGEHFHTELVAALSQLSTFDQKLRQTKSPEREVTALPEDASCSIVPNDELIVRVGTFRNSDFFPTSVGKPYKDYNSAFWIDASGKLRIFWEHGGKDTVSFPFVSNLSDRAYFKAISNNHGLRLPGHPPFWIEPLYSRIDGINRAVLAIPSKHNFFSDNRQVIAGLETRFASVFNPVLQPGTGYSVIDSDGRVLFHSATKRNLRENLLEETDQNRQLQSFMLSRGEGCFDGTYGGNAHRFCAMPIKDLPWSFVTFRNIEPYRTANLEAVTVATALFGSYFLIAVIVSIGKFLIYGARHGSHPPQWIWLTNCSPNKLLGICAVNTLLIITGFVSLCFLSPQNAFLMNVMVVPGSGAIMTYVVGSRSEPSSPSGQGCRFEPTYRLSIAILSTMLTIYSVLPAVACITLAYEGELLLLKQSEALEFSLSLSERSDRLARHYGTPITSPSDLADLERLSELRVGSVASQTTSQHYLELSLTNLLDVHVLSNSVPDEESCCRFPIWQAGSEPTMKVRTIRFWQAGNQPSQQTPAHRFRAPHPPADWFRILHRHLRVPYNNEFSRTQALFPETQFASDLQWKWNEANRGTFSIYHWPVHDLPFSQSATVTDKLPMWEVVLDIPHNTFLLFPAIVISSLCIGWLLLPFISKETSSRREWVAGLALALLVILYLCPQPLFELYSRVLLLIGFLMLVYLLPHQSAMRLHIFQSPKASQSVVQKEAPSTLTISNEWKGLTRNERLALFHLAKTGFLVSSHPGLPRLVAQGWVLNQGRIRPANPSIAEFVISKEDELLDLERAVSGGAWDRISWPLGFAIILLLGGLLYTQQDLLRSTAALVGMLTTVIPLTTKILDLLKGVRSSAPASST